MEKDKKPSKEEKERMIKELRDSVPKDNGVDSRLVHQMTIYPQIMDIQLDLVPGTFLRFFTAPKSENE